MAARANWLSGLLIVLISISGITPVMADTPPKLSQLNLTSPYIDQLFSSSTYTYNYEVETGTTSLQIFAKADSSTATVDINGTSHTESETVDVSLTSDSTLITIVVGTSPNSSTYTITVKRGSVPGTPSNLVGVSTGPTSARVSFDEDTYVYGFPTTSYTVYAYTTDDVLQKTETVTVGSGERYAWFTGLTSATAYKFKIKANNVNGSSPISNYSSVVTTDASLTASVNCAPTQSVNGTNRVLTFKSTTACNWKVPTGVTSVQTLVVGGGGGGGGANIGDNYFGGGGGGAGGQVISQNLAVTSGSQLLVKVGAGGAGGAGSTIDEFVTSGDFGAASYFGSLLALGGPGGHLGTTLQNRVQLGGDGGGSSQFRPNLPDPYLYQKNSDESNKQSCIGYPSTDDEFAEPGCSFWEGAGGGIGASGISGYNSTYATKVLNGEGELYVNGSYLKYSYGGRDYTSGLDFGGEGGRGGSGGPGVKSSITGMNIGYGGGGGGGGSSGTHWCDIAGFGLDGGGNGSRCTSISTPINATAGAANTGGGGGGGSYVTISGTLGGRSDAGMGATGGSGVVIISYYDSSLEPIDVPEPVILPSLSVVSHSQIHQVGTNLVCSIGKYNIGIDSNVSSATISSVDYSLMVDRQVVEKITSAKISVSWPLSKITAKGLATCQTLVSSGGTSYLDDSSADASLMTKPSVAESTAISAANSAYSNSASKANQDARSAKPAARNLWQANLEKENLAYSAAQELLTDKFNSNKLSRADYLKQYLALRISHLKAVQSNWKNYKQALLDIEPSRLKAVAAAKDIRDKAIALAKSDFAVAIELTGYGVVLGN